MFRVGFPNASQSISVSLSVRAPSVTSHIVSSMALASSNTTTILFPWLCSPANASVLFLLHTAESNRHVASCPFSRQDRDVAASSNQCRAMKRLYHFASSAQVFVFS